MRLREAYPEAVKPTSALALYQGDFLQEDIYEDWTYFERERLRESHLVAMTELAECFACLGRYRRATALCQQILAIDPCREAVYVRLMLYNYYAGDPAQALRAFERCCRALDSELLVEPTQETRSLASQIRAGTLWAVEGAPRYPPPAYQGALFSIPYTLGRPPFVGRQREYSGWWISGAGSSMSSCWRARRGREKLAWQNSLSAT
jgi:tetratricopeptide (TPR) repeat protein